jgi:Uma2 family endonuclease
MNAIVIEETVRIPDWVVDLKSFRRWARSDDFPEHGWFSHLKGELWVDLSMETLAHNKVKGEISIVLGMLVRTARRGHFFHDRMLLTNVEAELSTEPDAMFVSEEALEEGRVRMEEGADSLEVEGTPDMVLEVVSRTSVQKDTEVLRELYGKAGIAEYWLVDPRGTQVAFEILRHGPRGYVTTAKRGGWIKSVVFGKSFKLTQKPGADGLPRYTLAVK